MNIAIKQAAQRIMLILNEVQGKWLHEEALRNGIIELAELCGTELRWPVLNAYGEFSIFTIENSHGGCIPYGEEFVELLNGSQWRTGVISYGYNRSKLLPQNGWCYMPYMAVAEVIRKAAEA